MTKDGTSDAVDGEKKTGIRRIFDIQRDEWPLAIPLLVYFFLVITTFWILKPLKKGLFIGHYKASGVDIFGWHATAAQAELIAKIANMVAAMVAVAVFTLLARKLRRQQLTYVFSGFFAACFVYFAFALHKASGFDVWSFYLFGDLYSTVMVATFFAFTNDSVDSDAAKRLYGIVGLGGVAGGAFGSSIVSVWVSKLASTTWLWICLGIAAIVVLLAFLAARAVKHRASLPDAKAEEPESKPDPKKVTRNAAVEGAHIVFRSRYLLAIVAIVGLYEMVSTIMDFQFTSSVQASMDAKAIPGHFANVFAITNWVALFVQLFLTSFIMRRFGLAVSLMVLPVAASIGSVAFLAVPNLITGSALNTTDNAFSYSINQSSKEVLYVPTTRDEKYKAKAFIDMFVQRFAKALAVLLSLGISTWISSFLGVRLLSIATLVLLTIWGFAALSAGRRFHALEAENREKEGKDPLPEEGAKSEKPDKGDASPKPAKP